MIDFNQFDFPAIFGISKGTEGLKRNQTKFMRAEIFEEGMEEYSNGQLHYVGDSKNGADFVDDDGIFYESKGMDGMFSKRKRNNTETKTIILKNFRKQPTKIEQTFTYMLLWDTKSYSFGWCDWDACMKHTKIKDAVISFKVDFDDITFIAKNINPVDKDDFSVILEEAIIKWI